MGAIFDELRAALHAVWMRRWIALAVAWAVCLAGWFVVSQMPNRYESHARVFVQLRSILPDQDLATQNDAQKDIDRVRQTLTSTVNLVKVVKGTDLARLATTDKQVLDMAAGLQGAIKLTAQQDNLFEITVTGTSPKIAKQVAQKLIDIFVDDNLSDNRDATGQQLKWFDDQIATRQQQLQEADAKRSDFQSKYLGALPGTGSLSDRMDAARSQLAQVESDLSAAQSQLNTYTAQMSATPATIAGGGGATAGPARARLAAIQGQLADARARGWTDSYPDVVALKAQLSQAQAAASREPMVGGSAAANNPAYLSLQAMRTDKVANVAALSQRRTQIQSDLARLNSALNDNPAAASEQATIDRDYQAMKDQYDKLVAQREQVRIKSSVQNDTDAVKFNVIDPPTQPRAPVAPNRLMLLTGVLIAGIGAGVAAAFALAKLKTTYSTPTKLERASGMTVIGSIGEVVTSAQIAMRRKKLTLFAGGVGALCAAYVALLGVEFLQRGMGA